MREQLSAQKDLIELKEEKLNFLVKADKRRSEHEEKIENLLKKLINIQKENQSSNQEFLLPEELSVSPVIKGFTS